MQPVLGIFFALGWVGLGFGLLQSVYLTAALAKTPAVVAMPQIINATLQVGFSVLTLVIAGGLYRLATQRAEHHKEQMAAVMRQTAILDTLAKDVGAMRTRVVPQPPAPTGQQPAAGTGAKGVFRDLLARPDSAKK